MQGVVFTYRKRKKREKVRFNYQKQDIILFFKKWGIPIVFALALALGLGFGCFFAGGLSRDALGNLDFLFTTNMPQRLSGGAINAFCAGFASNFLFLLAAFLMGLSLWGVVTLPFIAFFKGFGVGVSAGYLLMTYGLKGIIFYLTVLLPGIVIFSLALVYQLSSAYNVFKRLCAALFSKNGFDFKKPLNIYLKSGLK